MNILLPTTFRRPLFFRVDTLARVVSSTLTLYLGEQEAFSSASPSWLARDTKYFLPRPFYLKSSFHLSPFLDSL